MTIGILTYHRAINYGAFLQVFALKNFLEQEKHIVEVIDYWPKGHAVAYDPMYISSDKHGFDRIKEWLYNIIRCRRYNIRVKKMQSLQQQYLNINPLTPKYTEGKELADIQYDCVIYGSDQIWWRHSPIASYPGFDPAFWGYYVSTSCKKIAYAASMGRLDIDDQDKLFIQKALSNFDAISVREEKLQHLLQLQTKADICLTIDPTLLMDKSFWTKYTQSTPIKEKYVLLYHLMPSKQAEQVARKKAKELGCRFIEITGSVRPLRLGKDYIQTADAFELISLIKNAEYVVSTSFHGVVFSILFEKQFCAIGMEKNASRVESLLTKLNLKERIVNNFHQLPTTEINYKLVNNELVKLKEQSIKFLHSAIID